MNDPRNSGDPFQPFTELDFEELLNPANWTETSAIHTPTLHAELTDERQKLTFTFTSGHQETIGRSDIGALTRYLIDHAQAAPLVVDEDVFKDIHPRKVDL
jgi:hypothetical protein